MNLQSGVQSTVISTVETVAFHSIENEWPRLTRAISLTEASALSVGRGKAWAARRTRPESTSNRSICQHLYGKKYSDGEGALRSVGALNLGSRLVSVRV